MIEVYSGTPGSGKSAHLASDIRYQLNRRHPHLVIANFPLGEIAPVKQRETFHYIPNEQLSVDRVVALCDKWWESHDFGEEKIWLCLDEVQMLFNSREWCQKGNQRMEWLKFFSQSRKYGVHVVFVAQNMMMIDNQFRMLVEYDIVHMKVENQGIFGWLISIPFGGRLIITHKTYVPLKSPMGNEWRTVSRKDMLMYDSYARFARADGGAALSSA